MKTAEADLLEARAVRFFDAARVLQSKVVGPFQNFWEPLNHLLGMAAELALKAYLTRSNTAASLLRKHDVRHNLERLLEEAISAGLHTTEEVILPLLHMSRAHADHSFRYTGPLKADKATVIFHADPHAAIASIGALLDHASPHPLRLRGYVGSGQEWLPSLPVLQPADLAKLQALKLHILAYQQSIIDEGPPQIA